MNDIFTKIRQERARQDKLHPRTDLTPAEWQSVLVEEVGEVSAEINHMTQTGEPLRENYITELIQVGALVVRIIEVYQTNAREQPIISRGF